MHAHTHTHTGTHTHRYTHTHAHTHTFHTRTHISHTQAVLPSMLERGSGRVVVVSSVQGKFGLPFRSSYAASKHALHGWFDSLRAEVADSGITVTIVCPGYVATNFSLGAVRGDGTAHGRMDETTASGMSPDALARRILAATATGVTEIITGDLQARAAVVLRALFPEMLAGILAKRARKGEGAA
jgi:dehydrogenase/reductase SDR family protein 7B